MIKEVIKKDGIREDYDTSKIVFAISNANRETNDKVTIDEIDKIVDIISKNSNEVLSTNEINNIIEEEDYRRFYQSEVERRNTLKSEINKLMKQREEKPTISKDEILEIISKLKNIEDWTSEKLSELLYNIEINKDNKIFINYRYDVIGKL